MEKLQPIIKQMFWIMFGLALMLVLWAWWSASNALSAAIEEGNSKVEKSYQDSKQPVDSVPNGKWTDGAAKENEQHHEAYSESARDLWVQQKNARVYPAKISDYLSKLSFGGTIAGEERSEFAKLYRRYFDQQLETISPFVQGDGLVEVNYGGITQEDESRWRTKKPTSTEIWHAQEDIWLLRSIYDAIAEVNAGATNIEKATIRSLQQLELRGGDPDAEPSSGASTGGFGGGGGGGYDDGGDMGMSGMSGMGGGASQVWSAFQGSLTSDLLVEEFGASAAGSTGGGGMGMMSSMMGESGGGYDDGDGGFGSATGAAEAKRYVADAEELPYKTRAFILKVRMIQHQVPSLLAALTNSSFPVEIVRVDASFGAPKSQSPGGGMGMSSMGGSGGYEGGGGGGYEGGGSGGAMPFGGGAASPYGGGGGFGSGAGGGFGGPAGFGGPPIGMAPGRAGRGKTKRPDPRKSGLYGRAMADPNLSTIRIAGLMTLYEPKEEKEAKEEAEQSEAIESQDTTGVDLPDAPPLGAERIEAAGTENTEGAEGGQPADGATTGETSETTPAQPGTPEGTPAPAGAAPAAVPDGATSPAPGETPEGAPAADAVGAKTEESSVPDPAGN